MKPLRCLHPALNHGDMPGERCRLELSCSRVGPAQPSCSFCPCVGTHALTCPLCPSCSRGLPTSAHICPCLMRVLLAGFLAMVEQNTHLWQSDGMGTRSGSLHHCDSASSRSCRVSVNPWSHPSEINRGELSRLGQSCGSRVYAEFSPQGLCCGAGGAGAARKEKTGPSAGIPERYKLLLKINDALEWFHFVSLTARPLQQPGRRIQHHSPFLLSPSSLCCSPSLKANQFISSPISTKIYSWSLTISCLTLLLVLVP